MSEKKRQHMENSARMDASAPEKNSEGDWLGKNLIKTLKATMGRPPQILHVL